MYRLIWRHNDVTRLSDLTGEMKLKSVTKSKTDTSEHSLLFLELPSQLKMFILQKLHCFFDNSLSKYFTLLYYSKHSLEGKVYIFLFWSFFSLDNDEAC